MPEPFTKLTCVFVLSFQYFPLLSTSLQKKNDYFNVFLMEFMDLLKSKVTLNTALLRGADRITMVIGS